MIRRAIQQKLKDAIAQNANLGYELGVDNLRSLYVERDLLKRESELLRNTENGIASQSYLEAENRNETKSG